MNGVLGLVVSLFGLVDIVTSIFPAHHVLVTWEGRS